MKLRDLGISRSEIVRIAEDWVWNPRNREILYMKMGRYSRGNESEMMVQELRELMENAPDENTRMEFQRFIQKIEQM